MLTFKKIVCPVDFSEASYEGLAKAVELATAGETEICVVHITQPVGKVSEIAGVAPFAHDEAARRADAVKMLGEVLDERVPAQVRSRPILREGDAGSEISHVAREEGADLIVLTTHGGRGWRCGEIGTVAETVLRFAPCPVLVYSGPATGRIECLIAERTDLPRPEALSTTPGKIYLDGD